MPNQSLACTRKCSIWNGDEESEWKNLLMVRCQLEIEGVSVGQQVAECEAIVIRKRREKGWLGGGDGGIKILVCVVGLLDWYVNFHAWAEWYWWNCTGFITPLLFHSFSYLGRLYFRGPLASCTRERGGGDDDNLLAELKLGELSKLQNKNASFSFTWLNYTRTHVHAHTQV